MEKLTSLTVLLFCFGCLMAAETHQDSVKRELSQILSDPASDPKQSFYQAVDYIEKQLPIAEQIPFLSNCF